MRNHNKEFIRGCDIFQRHKTENLALTGFLQSLAIPFQVWEDISMDFI